MGQRHIDRSHQQPRDHARLDGLPHHGSILLHALGPDVESDDNPEIQRSDGVHGLIALQKSLHRRAVRILLGRRPVSAQRPDQTARKDHGDQNQKRGTQHLAQAVRQLVRPERQRHGNAEKYHGINQLGAAAKSRPKAAQIWQHRHLEGSAGRSGNRQAGADGQVDQQRKHEREPRMNAPSQAVKPSGHSNRRNSQHRKPHRAEQKSPHRVPGQRPRLGSQKGRKNQISRPEKHRKQRKSYQQQVTPRKFLPHSSFSVRSPPLFHGHFFRPCCFTVSCGRRSGCAA